MISRLAYAPFHESSVLPVAVEGNFFYTIRCFSIFLLFNICSVFSMVIETLKGMHISVESFLFVGSMFVCSKKIPVSRGRNFVGCVIGKKYKY